MFYLFCCVDLLMRRMMPRFDFRMSKLIYFLLFLFAPFLQLLNGEEVKLKSEPSADSVVMPYHTMARLLAKAKFTARFTEEELGEVSGGKCYDRLHSTVLLLMVQHY